MTSMLLSYSSFVLPTNIHAYTYKGKKLVPVGSNKFHSCSTNRRPKYRQLYSASGQTFHYECVGGGGSFYLI